MARHGARARHGTFVAFQTPSMVQPGAAQLSRFRDQTRRAAERRAGTARHGAFVEF